jgi:hypothetical protein
MLSFPSKLVPFCHLCFQTYLDSSSKTEDPVVCLLLRKTFKGEKDSLGLLGDQVIGSIMNQSSAQILYRSKSIEGWIVTTEEYRRRSP